LSVLISSPKVQARRKLGRIIDFKLDPRAPQGVRTAIALGA
jgi:hypothetical protein